jgi:hypothetical protein
MKRPYVIDDTHEPLPPNFIAETEGTRRLRAIAAAR